jgi:hypothetical protein
VSVMLPGSEVETSNTSAKKDSTLDAGTENLTFSSNHYDDPTLAKQAEMDLPMNPGNDCAMFFGLEVLDASQYQVVGTGISKRLVISESAGEEVVIEKKQEPQEKHNDEKDKEKPTIESRKKRKTGKTKSKNTIGAQLDDPQQMDATKIIVDGSRRKKKRENKSTQNSPLKENEKDSADNTEQVPVSPDQLARIQSSWSEASGGAHIHSRLLESLHRLGFFKPTPIQAATLSASIMGRRNLVGAAPTGSGKTLAFLIPILNHILEQNNDLEKRVENKGHSCTVIQALIMTPTRELASQIHAECDKLFRGQCVTLVGGIALVKQKRLLDTNKPSIVIATPGRLWAMVSRSISPLFNINGLGRHTSLRLSKLHRRLACKDRELSGYICTSVRGLRSLLL